MADNIVYVCRN